ncbi:MAG: Rpn family recombination-promoting nuclease/putative transposase [Ruminococcus sp.]|nr:Rpn family recombination-promoting nuclease/putative transposase [Ruminococcus sp.]
MVASLLEIPTESIQSINVLNTEVIPDSADEKFSRLDLKIRMDDRIVNVEMQMNCHRNFADRAVFYWARLFSGELKSGEEYKDLKQTITINILNFNLFDPAEFPDHHSHYTLTETTKHTPLTDKCSIHFFELTKLRQLDQNDRMSLWLHLINAETEEELDMLQQTNVPEIQKAVGIVHTMSADERVRELARIREKALHDEVSALGGAKEEGREEGRKEGRIEGINEAKSKLIAALRTAGVPEEQINISVALSGL